MIARWNHPESYKNLLHMSMVTERSWSIAKLVYSIDGVYPSDVSVITLLVLYHRDTPVYRELTTLSYNRVHFHNDIDLTIPTLSGWTPATIANILLLTSLSTHYYWNLYQDTLENAITEHQLPIDHPGFVPTATEFYKLFDQLTFNHFTPATSRKPQFADIVFIHI